MLLTEFDQKKHDKNMWQEGHDEGFDEGHAEGFDEGYDECLRNSIVSMISKGKSPEEIADFCGYDIDQVRKIASSIK